MPDYLGGKQHTTQGIELLFISNRGEFASIFFFRQAGVGGLRGGRSVKVMDHV
jgi:hypothetical protein